MIIIADIITNSSAPKKYQLLPDVGSKPTFFLWNTKGEISSFVLCRRKSHRFEMTWESVNDDRIIFSSELIF